MPEEKFDAILKSKIESDMNLENKDNPVWKDRYSIDNFIVICTDSPASLECTISMGYKNKTAPDQTEPDSINGQHIRVDAFTAQMIMAKTKQELYDIFIAKDTTKIIQ